MRLKEQVRGDDQTNDTSQREIKTFFGFGKLPEASILEADAVCQEIGCRFRRGAEIADLHTRPHVEIRVGSFAVLQLNSLFDREYTRSVSLR